MKILKDGIWMPNDNFQDTCIPLPYKDTFKTIEDLLKQFKMYAFKAGFSVAAVDYI